MSGQVLEPYTSAHCRSMAAFHRGQIPFYESRGWDRNARDSRRHAEQWERSAAIAAEKEGALW